MTHRGRVQQPVGFESIAGALERLAETDISETMKGKNSSGYFRFPFSLIPLKKRVSGELRATIDDGFIAH